MSSLSILHSLHVGIPPTSDNQGIEKGGDLKTWIDTTVVFLITVIHTEFPASVHSFLLMYILRTISFGFSF